MPVVVYRATFGILRTKRFPVCLRQPRNQQERSLCNNRHGRCPRGLVCERCLRIEKQITGRTWLVLSGCCNRHKRLRCCSKHRPCSCSTILLRPEFPGGADVVSALRAAELACQRSQV